MKGNNRELGNRYERLAGRYLEQQGYRILDYNFYCRGGEIDIVARDGEYLVFTEVKYRASMAQGAPLEAISKQKQRTICKSALHYIKAHGLEYMPVRFDVVGIMGNTMQVIKNAFDYIA